MRMHIHPKANAEATLKRLQEKAESERLKFCKDCQFHGAEYDRDKGKYHHQCNHPQLLDMVTGRASNPLTNRSKDALCGRGAKWFLQKIKSKPLTTTEQNGG